MPETTPTSIEVAESQSFVLTCMTRAIGANTIQAHSAGWLPRPKFGRGVFERGIDASESPVSDLFLT